MPSPALTPTYILAAIAAVVTLFITQNVIDSRTGQLVSGLAAVFVPLAFVVAESILKGHQAQATSRLEAARIQSDAVRAARPVPRSHAAK